MLEDIKRIEGHDVTILRLGESNDAWFTAYVRLLDMNSDAQYGNETFRQGNVIGVDTNHLCNISMSISEKFIDVQRQIEDVIRCYNNMR